MSPVEETVYGILTQLAHGALPWLVGFSLVITLVVFMCASDNASAWQGSLAGEIDTVRLYPEGYVVFYITVSIANSGCTYPDWVQFGPEIPSHKELYGMVFLDHVTKQSVAVFWDGYVGHVKGGGFVLQPR